MRGVLLERAHQARKLELCVAGNFQIPANWSRLFPQRHSKMRFENGTTVEHVDDWADPQELLVPFGEWTGLTTFTLGPDKSIVPDTD